GRSVDITLPEGSDVDPSSFGDMLAEATDGGSKAVGIRVEKNDDGPTILHLDLWCDHMPPNLADAIRAAHPSLAQADIRETPLSGEVPASVAGLIGYALFDVQPDAQSVETVRAQVRAQLAGQGIDPANVQVDSVAGPDGKAGLKITVREKKVALDDAG